ncbi:MAG: NAD(+) diphosphatase [Treponema sp.]|nr:NAD(+) diphosphatase [Candidatus Treponema equifaecale]
MALTSNFTNDVCSQHFIIRENSIVLQNGKLPGEEIVKKCLAMNVAQDWFYEKDLDYSALMLEPDSPNPAGCDDIPLREFFHTADAKSASLAARAKGLLNFKASKRYCAKCGGALHDDENFTARTCVQCGKQYFPQLEPAVIILVNKGDQLLLALHKNRNDGVYGCIAGFVEIGETIEQTVEREIMEEVGLKVKNIRYVGSQSWPFPDQLMLAFRAEYESGEIKIQEDELRDAQWFSRDSLPKIPPPGSVAHNLISGYFD